VSATDDLLDNNRAYAERFEKGDLPLPPAKKIAVIACMDARLVPSEVLGLSEGDAHVIRNPGGVVTDAELRALAISQRKLGTEEIVLIHHTDCGMLGFSDEEFAAQLESETGVAPGFPGHSFDDHEADIRDAIARIKQSPFIPHTESVRGFIYEVGSGRLREVE
jgi:carbonic anhydrase